MSFLKSKKGDSTEMSLAHILDIGLVTLAILLLTSFVYKASSGEFIEEKKIALNTGILIDTLISASGNTFLSADIANNTIKITDKGVEVGKKWTQYFPLLQDRDTRTISDMVFNDITNIEFYKTGNNLYVNKKIKKVPALSCPFILIEKPNKAVIMPKNEFRLETALKQALGSEIQITKTDSLVEHTQFAIKLDAINGTAFKLEIPPNSIKSRRLACTMANELQQENPDIETEIVVIEHPLFEKSDTAVIITLTSELNNDITTFLSLSSAFKSTFT
jgi:hypothetical protein|tara:strand:+ start:22 stop:849 length:828 start_codon:yes stop_codon:yes gene_type:complete